jgi:hypothetical protein
MILSLCPDRVRKIKGSFAFIEHRFLQDGFWSDLDQHGLLLYLFLVLVADRHGLSYYSYDKICTLLRLTLDEYILARDSLINKDLIAFDGRLFQVLSLPPEPKRAKGGLLSRREQLEREDPATVRQLIEKSFKRHSSI